MKPYFAIIKDSFRAAWASKVLYVLLALITLLLLAIAPLHYRQSLDWKLIPEDYFQQAGTIVQRLMVNPDDQNSNQGEGQSSNQDQGSNQKLIHQIWIQLPEGLRDDLVEQVEQSPSKKNRFATKNSLSVFRELVGELNLMVDDPDFFSAPDLSALKLNEDQIAEFQQSGKDANAKRRLNRLIIAKLLSPFVDAGSTTSMTAWYGPWRLNFLDRFVSSKTQFASGVAAYIPRILDKFVLSIGLAIAIVVTASIIPETFEPGSLNLLLSKPISRFGLFLAKFVGGCIFIAICATYLFSGLWLWLGLALGVWEHAILLSILLYIIVFGIYFSVSAFVGLMYRSTVLAIMVTLFFWGVCFLVGTTHGFLDTRLNNKRIVELAQTGNTIYALDRMSQVNRWDAQMNHWVSPFSRDDQGDQRPTMTANSWLANMEGVPLPFGPLVNPFDQRLIVGRTTSSILSFGQQELFASSPGGGTLQNEGNFPRGTRDFLQGSKALIAVTGEGKFSRFADQSTQPAQDRTDNRLFVSLGPDRLTPVFNRGSCAINHKTGEIAIYSNRTIAVYAERAKGYVFDRSIEVETGAPESMTGLLAFQGDTLLLALGNGQLISLDRETLKEQFGYRPQNHHAIESLTGSPDGRWFFASYRNGYVWALDRESLGKMALANFAGQGSLSSIAFNAADASDGENEPQTEVLVADRKGQVTRYPLPDFQRGQSLQPQDSTVETIYYWIVRPLYSVWPKPGEFYRVITWIAQANDSQSGNNIDLRLKSNYRNPWAPLTSGLTFMGVMLGMSCLYFWRKDY